MSVAPVSGEPPVQLAPGITLLIGDCIARMRSLPDASVDNVVTDPPYDLTANKKGGTGVASVNLNSPYGRSRIGTGNGAGGFMGEAWDSTGIAFTVELWTECLRVLKPGGHVLAFGASRTWHRVAAAIEDAGFEIRDSIAWLYGSGFPKSLNLDGDWEGWGTALKPAFEPLVVARKPLKGTVAGNLQAYGTGALNIDACRTETSDDLNGGAYAEVGNRSVSASLPAGSGMNVPGKTVGRDYVPPTGRWPANVILDESQAAALDEQSGEPQSRYFPTFHYEAKASTAERPVVNGLAHPTVKPLALIRWLVRLVTAPGGIVLDPFAGSGTTAEACLLEDLGCITIEKHRPYVPLIEARMARRVDPVAATRLARKITDEDDLFSLLGGAG